MGGGLMQLVAYGAQDIYLTGNPQITFFKVVYRRHTNFSMEAIKQTFNGTTGFGNEVTATISRNGDLVHRMYLEHQFTASDNDVDIVQNYGHALINDCELEIGGQKIDKHYGHWMQIWSDLTEFNPSGHLGTVGAQASLGNGTGTLFQGMTGTGVGINGGDVNTVAHPKIFIPLQFWFCRNPGLALPLIALQYHEVKVKLNIQTSSKLCGGGTLTMNTLDLYCDYIYLDTDERRRFAQVSHEYLIEQLQYSSNSVTSESSNTVDINFNHPVKEIVWQFTCSDNLKDCKQAAANEPNGDESLIAAGATQTGGTSQLKLNGHDRFKERDFRYFTRAQVWEHHTGYGGQTTSGTGAATGATGTATGDTISVYSFALKPEEHQPSGTCNFSRIDNAQLVLTNPVAGANTNVNVDEVCDAVRIYAVNYNVLRIMSGMGGLAYSN